MALFCFCGLRELLRGRDPAQAAPDEAPFSGASSLSTFSDLAPPSAAGRRHSGGTEAEAQAAKEAARAVAAARKLFTSDWTRMDSTTTSTGPSSSIATTASVSSSSHTPKGESRVSWAEWQAKRRTPSAKELRSVSNALKRATSTVESSQKEQHQTTRQKIEDDEADCLQGDPDGEAGQELSGLLPRVGNESPLANLVTAPAIVAAPVKTASPSSASSHEVANEAKTYMAGMDPVSHAALILGEAVHPLTLIFPAAGQSRQPKAGFERNPGIWVRTKAAGPSAARFAWSSLLTRCHVEMQGVSSASAAPKETTSEVPTADPMEVLSKKVAFVWRTVWEPRFLLISMLTSHSTLSPPPPPISTDSKPEKEGETGRKTSTEGAHWRERKRERESKCVCESACEHTSLLLLESGFVNDNTPVIHVLAQVDKGEVDPIDEQKEKLQKRKDLEAELASLEKLLLSSL